MQRLKARAALRAVKSKKGFTLIEIIVVLVILAILMAALIPTMMGYVDDARQKTQLATAKAYYTAALAVTTENVALGTTGFDATYFDNNTDAKTAKWRALTADLPGAGSKTAVPGCVVKLNDTASTTVAVNERIKSIKYTYDTNKFIFMDVTLAGEITIYYDEEPPAAPTTP